MERLKELEALGLALLAVVRDSRYDESLRCAMRTAYDSVEEAICRLEGEIRPPANDGNPTVHSN